MISPSDGDTSDNDDNGEDADTCSCCHYEKQNGGEGDAGGGCQCHSILDNVTRLNGVLSELDLIEEIVNPAIVTAVYEQVHFFFALYHVRHLRYLRLTPTISNLKRNKKNSN